MSVQLSKSLSMEFITYSIEFGHFTYSYTFNLHKLCIVSNNYLSLGKMSLNLQLQLLSQSSNLIFGISGFISLYLAHIPSITVHNYHSQ